MLALLDFMKLYDKSLVDLLGILGIALPILGVMFLFFKLILSYLDGEADAISGKNTINYVSGYNTVLDEESKTKLVQDVKEKIQKEAVDNYLEELQESLKYKNIIEYSKFQSSETLTRIERAIRAQNAKANVNLLLGMVTAIIGIGFLIFFIPNYNAESFDLSQFLITFLPRLSVVVLIETFAYFFLRMYKYNLNEIKYFQNEATGIEHRLHSLNVAIQTDDKETLKIILLLFCEIDKNKEAQQIINEHIAIVFRLSSKNRRVIEG